MADLVEQLLGQEFDCAAAEAQAAAWAAEILGRACPILSLPPEILGSLAAAAGLFDCEDPEEAEVVHWEHHQHKPRAWVLYAACKSFAWLGGLEYLCADHAEGAFSIYAVDVAGRKHGMELVFCGNGGETPLLLEGFGRWERAALVGNYTFVRAQLYSPYPREVGGARYLDPVSCCYGGACQCATCSQLRVALEAVRAADPLVVQIAAREGEMPGCIALRAYREAPPPYELVFDAEELLPWERRFDCVSGKFAETLDSDWAYSSGESGETPEYVV